MLKVIASILFCIITLNTWAETSFGEKFEEAFTLYNNNEYEEAAQLYEQILNEKGPSFEVYYNLGNSYYKSGQIGQAILNYERALKINHKDEDARFNLRLANMRIKDKIDELPENAFKRFGISFVQIFSLRTWSILAIIFFWIALSGLTAYLLLRRIEFRKAGFFTALIALSLAVFTLLMAFSRNQFNKQDKYVIITQPSTLIKSAPSRKSTDIYLLHEGFKMKIRDEASGWIEVKLPDGNIGWVDAGAVEMI